MQKLRLYRKRIIPEETIFLENDVITFKNADVLVTKWQTLKPRKDFSRGESCYFLKDGIKVSKFINEKDELLYYYCDIIDVFFDAKENSFIFTDLLADVIIYCDGRIKVVDLGEIPDAIESGGLSLDMAKLTLKRLDKFLEALYNEGIAPFLKWF